MICPSCKNEISNAHSHCYVCGYDLREHIAPLHCKCGSIRPGSHIYCTDCGRELSRENVVVDKARVAAFYAERAVIVKQAIETTEKKQTTIEDLIASKTSLKAAAAPQAAKTVASVPQKKDSSFLIVGLLSLVSLVVLFFVVLDKKGEVENPEAAKVIAAAKATAENAAKNAAKPATVDSAKVDSAKVAVITSAKTNEAGNHKPAVATPSAATENGVKQKSVESNYIAPIKAVKAEAVADVAENNGKKLRYLVTTSGGIIGYFADGTYSALPQGTFTKESIKTLYAAPTTGNYKGTLTVGAGDKNWLVVDYKWTKVPQ
ncbi:MAG TPA: hypothetical protein VGB84_02555 [Arachidicoccus sp.]